MMMFMWVSSCAEGADVNSTKHLALQSHVSDGEEVGELWNTHLQRDRAAKK